MGDVADMMIGGVLCAECGGVLEAGNEAPDIPILCHDCHSEYQKRCDIPHDEPNGGAFCERFYNPPHSKETQHE